MRFAALTLLAVLACPLWAEDNKAPAVTPTGTGAAPAAPAKPTRYQESETGITHSFLVTGGKTYIYKVDKDKTEGSITWEYPASTREGEVLASGNILLCISKGGKYPGGGAVEITRDQKVLWEYKGTQDEVASIQKTADGTYVLSEEGKNPRMMEIDKDGKVVVEFPLDCQKTNSHMETRMSRKQPDGTYLAPHLLDFAIKQYDKTGKVISVIKTDVPDKKETWPFTAIRLPNGNTLAGLTHSGTLAEFSSEGKRVWEVTNEDVKGQGINSPLIQDACGIQRLPNGNTIVCSYAAKPGQVRLFEITPEKKVVWKYISPDGAGVHEIHVFETNGVPLDGPVLR